MVHINIRYQGNLRCQAEHGPSSTTMVTDAPVDNHGRGESFSPTDLLATALGTCIITVMGIEARKHDWNIDGAEVLVKKTMASQPVRKVARLDVEVRMPTALDASAREALEAAGHTCPVALTLGDRVEQPIRFVWPDS